MRFHWKAGSAGLLLALFASAPATAQHYRWDFGVNTGWGITSSVLDDDDQAINQGKLGFDNNWQYGAQLGYWFSRGIGLRANLSYTSSPFMQGDGATLVDDVNLWSGTTDLLVRLLKPRRRWSGAEWLPYLAFGIGAHWVNPPGDAYIAGDEIDDDDDFNDPLEIEGSSGAPIVCRIGFCFGPSTPGFPGIGDAPVAGTRTLFLKEASSFAGLLGLGVDLRLAPSFAVRAEVGDLIWGAPLDDVEQRENVFSVVRSFDGVGSTVHQFYATLGLNVLFGLKPPPMPVAVLPPPAPAPPPPPPTTEDITVCVVDPTTRNGLRTITAQRQLASGDTTVIRDGSAVELSELVAGIPVANNANWYVRGAPFEFGRDPNRLVYLNVGSARTIDPNTLAFLGTVDGLPVFAYRSGLPTPLENLGPNTDLSRLVADSKDAFTAVESVTTLFVPLQPTGCVFQGLDKQVNIRKK